MKRWDITYDHRGEDSWMWEKEDGKFYLASEADAELKRRDDDIAELNLRIAVALKSENLTNNPYKSVTSMLWALTIPIDELKEFIEQYPEFVPSGNGPISTIKVSQS